jgi:hypothetical protein
VDLLRSLGSGKHRLPVKGTVIGGLALPHKHKSQLHEYHCGSSTKFVASGVCSLQKLTAGVCCQMGLDCLSTGPRNHVASHRMVTAALRPAETVK